MSTPRWTHPARKSFGLVGAYHSQRIILPLKGVECEFSCRAGIAEVCVSQIFRQENAKPLDCEFLFPLPADASVFLCEADVNERIIRAEVRERGEARKLAAEKQAAGFRALLVQSERDNLFTLSLGNIQPSDLIIVRLKYFQPVRKLGAASTLEIPLCPGTRYIPGKPLLRGNVGNGPVQDTDQVPDASRITPQQITSSHPDAAFIEIRGTLDGMVVDQGSIISPSHRIEFLREAEELSVTLVNKGEVPDRNFVLRWNERRDDDGAFRAWVHKKENEHYALLELIAPERGDGVRRPVDFYFLLDGSGSMSGIKWEKAIEAFQRFVSGLNPSDRVMATVFSDSYHDFAEQPLAPEALSADSMFPGLRNLPVGGGTNLLPALMHVLEIVAKHSKGRNCNLILITDGQVGNESAILALLKTLPDLPVHCLGIDLTLNDSLLAELSRQQGGTFHSLHPNDDISSVLDQIRETLRSPVLLNVRVAEGWELADPKPLNLYAGQTVYLAARTEIATPLIITGHRPDQKPMTFNFSQGSWSSSAPYLCWCKSRIQYLLSKNDPIEAIKLSIESNLLCRLTAFVAWDESEKVPIASIGLIQPSVSHLGRIGQIESDRMCDGLVSRAYLIQPHRGDGSKDERSDTLRSRAKHHEEPDPIEELLKICMELSYLVGGDVKMNPITNVMALQKRSDHAKKVHQLFSILRTLRALLVDLIECNAIQRQTPQEYIAKHKALILAIAPTIPESTTKRLSALISRDFSVSEKRSAFRLARWKAEIRRSANEAIENFCAEYSAV